MVVVVWCMGDDGVFWGDDCECGGVGVWTAGEPPNPNKRLNQEERSVLGGTVPSAEVLLLLLLAVAPGGECTDAPAGGGSCRVSLPAVDGRSLGLYASNTSL